MPPREFIAIGQENVDLAAWAAAPYGWTARRPSRAELVPMGLEGRAVELVHPRAPIAVVVVEEPPSAHRRPGRSSGAFLYFSAERSDAMRLSEVLQHPAIQQLVESLGAAARRSRLDGLFPMQ